MTYGADEKTISLQKPEDCSYESEIHLDLDDIEPLLAVPHRVDNAVPVTEYSGTPIDQVFVGTCTNGRFEDLKRFADIVRGKKSPSGRSSRLLRRMRTQKALSTGVLADILEAGCVICPPGMWVLVWGHTWVFLVKARWVFPQRTGISGTEWVSVPSIISVLLRLLPLALFAARSDRLMNWKGGLN